MNNRDYARVLEETSYLMQIKGVNRFRIRAFENAARTIATYQGSIEDLLDQGEVTSLSGIGDGIADQLHQIRTTGTSDQHEQLLEELDAGLLDLFKIQGLGPKRIKILYEELDLTDLEMLRRAAEAGEIRSLKGFGTKTEEKILAEIERLQESGGRIPLPRAFDVAHSLRDQLLALDPVERIEVAGSLRRGRETVGDIDLLVATDDPVPIHEHFRTLLEVKEVLASGQTKTSVRLLNGIQVDLRTVEPRVFGSALHYFTGSKEHHVALRTRAKRQGLKISEYGVFRIGEESPLASRTEEELFQALGLRYIPPELREGQGEIEAAENDTLPALVQGDQILGDLHMHTVETDGRATLEEMVAAARQRGYRYIAITDHSQAVRVANGMDPHRFAAQIDTIHALNDELDEFRLLAGIEVDILKDGSLDMDHELLARCDWVVGSIHSHFGLSSEAMTQRLLRAIDTGLLSCLGHPTGRILGGRKGYDYDFDAVVEAAVERGVALELNGSSGRVDLDAGLASRAHDLGALLVLGSDAHSTAGLDALRFAVQQARRAGLEASQVLNCLDVDELLSTIGRSAAD